MFWAGNVMIGGKTLPLGQTTTDILNLDGQVLTEIEKRISVFQVEIRELLEQKNNSAVFPAQEKLNAVWDVVFTLPFYRDLPMDERSSRNLFPMLLSDKKKWNEVFTEGTEGNRMMREFVSRLEYFPESLRNFIGQVSGMLELYFEQLTRRNSAAYAAAYSKYFRDMASAGPLFFGDMIFEQSFSVQVKFTPMRHPAKNGKNILAEQAEFSALSHFLYTDFYRGLIIGNAPRRCHNCGRFFLLNRGYNTCYCNNIAPGETLKTCRKIGAHRKAQDLSGATPAQLEYRKVYNRLKTRKSRGNINTDEWNATVAKALDLKDRAERGEIDDAELKRLYEQF
jgi:hypothetical protein